MTAAAAPKRRRRAKPALTKLDPVTRQAIEEACERAAKRAAHRAMRDVLLLMGVDARTPEGLLATQKNNAFLNRVREASESRPAKYGFAAFSTLMSIVGGLIVYVITHWNPFAK